MYWRPGRSSSAMGTWRAKARASNGVIAVIARLTVDCDTP